MLVSACDEAGRFIASICLVYISLCSGERRSYWQSTKKMRRTVSPSKHSRSYLFPSYPHRLPPPLLSSSLVVVIFILSSLPLFLLPAFLHVDVICVRRTWRNGWRRRATCRSPSAIRVLPNCHLLHSLSITCTHLHPRALLYPLSPPRTHRPQHTFRHALGSADQEAQQLSLGKVRMTR